MRFRSKATNQKRRGLSSLEAVMTLGVSLPLAVLLYFVAEYVMDLFYFLVGNSVGSPYL